MIYELMLYENIRFEEKTSSPLCYVFAVGPLWNFNWVMFLIKQHEGCTALAEQKPWWKLFFCALIVAMDEICPPLPPVTMMRDLKSHFQKSQRQTVGFTTS